MRKNTKATKPHRKKVNNIKDESMYIYNLGNSCTSVELKNAYKEEIREWIKSSGVLAPPNIPLDKGHHLMLDKYNNRFHILTIERMKALYPKINFTIPPPDEVT